MEKPKGFPSNGGRLREAACRIICQVAELASNGLDGVKAGIEIALRKFCMSRESARVQAHSPGNRIMSGLLPGGGGPLFVVVPVVCGLRGLALRCGKRGVIRLGLTREIRIDVHRRRTLAIQEVDVQAASPGTAVLVVPRQKGESIQTKEVNAYAASQPHLAGPTVLDQDERRWPVFRNVSISQKICRLPSDAQTGQAGQGEPGTAFSVCAGEPLVGSEHKAGRSGCEAFEAGT